MKQKAFANGNPISCPFATMVFCQRVADSQIGIEGLVVCFCWVSRPVVTIIRRLTAQEAAESLGRACQQMGKGETR